MASLSSKKARLTFGKYNFAGILEKEDGYATGNPTFWCLPKEMRSKYIHRSDSLFHSILSSIWMVSEQSNIIDHIVTYIKGKLKSLVSFFRNGQLYCIYRQMKVEDPMQGECEAIRFIKGIDPYQIDWSNIPDYYEREVFIRMARAVNGHDTLHTAHFMNWMN